MKTLKLLSTVFIISLVLLSANHSLADDSAIVDKNVKGLWIEAPHIQAERYSIEEGENGAVSFTRIFDGGALLVERIPYDSDPFGSELDPANIFKFIKAAEGVEKSAVKLDQDESLSAQYSYPVYLARYATDLDGDTKNYIDMYLFTDPYVFRVLVLTLDTFEGDSNKQAMEWLSSLTIRD